VRADRPPLRRAVRCGGQPADIGAPL